MLRILLTVLCFFFVCSLVSPAVSQKIDKKAVHLKKKITRLKKTAPAKPVRIATLEAVAATHEAEELPGELDSAKFLDDYKRLRFEAGGMAGVFGGTTAFLIEARLPLRWLLGPTTSVFRLSAGLTQTREMDRRYLPLNFDLIFNFPPGWFSGVGGYLGAGVNYVLRSTGGQPGTIGLQAFYGVDSDGFGGKLFGEIGYGILRSGITPANRGPNVLFGYRKVFGL